MEERNPREVAIPMEKASQILRKSVHSFLQNYQFLTTNASILALPFTTSFLLSQAFVPSYSSLFPTISNRLTTLFHAAGFPPSQFFSLVILKFSQTISTSIFVLPFYLTFLLIAKASVTHALTNHKPNSSTFFSSLLSLYIPLLKTLTCNSFLLLSTYSTTFLILFFAFNFLQGFRYSSPESILLLSAVGAVLYSFILADALVVCNLAMTISGVQKSGGFLAVLRACVLLRGRTSTALSLAVPVNLLLAAIEALFHYRIVRAYHFAGKAGISSALEGVFIAYMYSIFVVLETLVSYMFFRCCKTSCFVKESGYTCRIEIAEEECIELKHDHEQLPL